MNSIMAANAIISALRTLEMKHVYVMNVYGLTIKASDSKLVLLALRLVRCSTRRVILARYGWFTSYGQTLKRCHN